MKTFSEILKDSREESVQKYLEQNRYLLLTAFSQVGEFNFGCRWIIPKFKFGNEFISDFVIISLVRPCSGVYYKITLIELEPPTEIIFTKNGKYAKRLNDAIGQINDWNYWINDNMDYFRRCIANKINNKTKSDITKLDCFKPNYTFVDWDSEYDSGDCEWLINDIDYKIREYENITNNEIRVFISSKIIIGRRNILTVEDTKRMMSIYNQSNRALEIVTYDRLLEIEQKTKEKQLVK